MRAVILLVSFYGALSQPVENEVLKEFVNGNHKFTAAVYKEILKNEKGNFIASPFSVETVLALTNEGAKGDTSSELITGLSLPKTKDNIQKFFKTFLPKLKKSDEELKILSANKIYVKEGVKLENDFKSIATSIYNSGVSDVDFKNKVEAAETINNWVEDNTNHKIKNLIDPDTLDKDTSMILVNALYFSGKWASEFQSYSTYKKKFFKTKDETVDIDTMYQSEYLSYYENPALNTKFLKLDYRGADVSMTFVLPNAVDGLATLEENVEQLLVTQPLIKAIIEVEIPKFVTETSIKFKPILQDLGIQKLFTDEADLTGLSSSDKNLLVSDVVQKAFINVTETGTEAAAATAVHGVPSSLPPPPKYSFKADHPFLYFIKYNGIVLFVGRYATPS
ncbi:antichymotrypsin-2 isoform X3 [Anoplophora glabripennis]|uniref:antichymotrypsin-2 isoform X3 n=1 Tax=Anoplophora glabripennis TaxID=217634 RepID=UPI00087422A7|nr:antichymotrypsin-2 isoform X3 [Anoplophora glabripennis]